MTCSQSSEASDGSLLRRYQTGEQEAATQLYLRYAARLLGLAQAQTGQDLRSRIDPDDIVQSVFRTFFRRAREGQYEAPDGDELWRLFLVIGLHKIRDAAAHHRAARRNVSRTQRLSDADGFDEPAAAALEVAETTLRLTIEELMEQLSQNQREIVTMRLAGATVGEIAGRLQRSLRTVERTLQKFRDLLTQQISPEQSK